MEGKFHQNNIFENGFDSFDFDDGFLMKVDLESKKNKLNEIKSDKKTVKHKGNYRQNNIPNEKRNLEKKTQYYNMPLFIEDLNESDLFESSKKKTRIHSPKAINGCKNEIGKKPAFSSCLSPILGPKSTNQMILSSSTPVKPNDDPNPNENIKSPENPAKNFDYVYSDVDLFDDWDINDINKEKSSQKSTVTLSQAFQLIEEAESAKESKEKQSLNQSIDLLTGEVVGDMFEESFGLPEATNNKQAATESSNDSVIVVKEVKVSQKPPAAQKLHFEKVSHSNLEKENNLRNICFDSDDDGFDFLTQELLEKPKNILKNNHNTSNINKSSKVTPLKCLDLDDSVDGVIQCNKRKGKCFNVIESDTTEDSPSPKFRRQSKPKRNFQRNFGKEFIESEADVSDEIEVSSDEAEEEGEYDKSFLDEESYFTQNTSANMTSKYLESVKAINRPGGFKIPAAKPYNPMDIFSQVPEQNNTDYEIDSFCVNEVEEDIKTDLSDLEIAEKVLEMDRKKRRKKRFQKFKKIK